MLPSEIGDQLLPNERVLWWGTPRQGLMLAPRDALLIPFSLFWGGFAIVWETTVLNSKAPYPLALFGMPFVAIGLFLIFGRFFVDSWLRSRTVYAVTDRRVLIARSRPWRSFQSFDRDSLPGLELNEGAGGRGTIRFGQNAAAFGYGGGGRMVGGAWIPALDPTPQFIQVGDARAVFAMLHER